MSYIFFYKLSQDLQIFLAKGKKCLGEVKILLGLFL